MKNRFTSIHLLATVTLFFGLAAGVLGCSLSPANPPSSTAEIKISVPDLSGPHNLEAFFAQTAAPAKVSGFNCVGFNVIGPGIVPSDSGNDGDPNQIYQNLLSQASHCSYAGVTSPPVAMTGGTQTISLVVPTGNGRLIQAIGVQDPGGQVCGSTTPLGSQNQNNTQSQTGFFEIGRSVVNLLSDTAVSLSNTYDTLNAADQAARTVNCNNGGPNGPPPPGGCMPSDGNLNSGAPTLGDLVHSGIALGQKFVAAQAESISSVAIPLSSATALSSSSFTVQIYGDSGASGSNGTAVSVSAIGNGPSLVASTPPQMVLFNFSTAVSLNAGTTYWLVLTISTLNATWAGFPAVGSGANTCNDSQCANGHITASGNVQQYAFGLFNCM